MTKEEALKELKEYEDGVDIEYATPFDKAILYAIKALEQEPNTDTWTIKDVANELEKHGFGLLELEPKKGHWNYTDAYPHWVCCDKCKTRFIPNKEWIEAYNIPTNYCPNCGAKMESEE